MEIQIFPALNGDCFLIEILDGHYILIDGGYVDTYREYLLPKLRELYESGSHLDLLVVTHIDSDHISGIIKLLEETPNLIPIDNIWYNGYRNVQKCNIEKEMEETVSHHNICKESLKDETKPVSAKQGCTLSSLIQRSGIPWNIQFDSNIVVSPNSISIGTLIVHILSPNNEDIADVSKYWRKCLLKTGLLEKEHCHEFWDDAFEFCMGQDKPGFQFHTRQVGSINDLEAIRSSSQYTPDSSSTNGSSIAFILEYEGKRILCLGDAHAETIVDSLRQLYVDADFPIVFDAIKLSHHGSFNNNSPELLNMIDSSIWIVSTNGDTYDHPDLETLAHILTKNKSKERFVYFNYKLPICDTLLNSPAAKEYSYKIITPQNNEVTTITV